MPPYKVVHNSAFIENLSIVLLNESLLKFAIPKVTFKDVTNDSTTTVLKDDLVLLKTQIYIIIRIGFLQ